ncbi:DEAD/DEAH box helicase [Desulfobacula phenolica]|uniref:Superfamily II DNA or RNA helicase, SNF2 family n=1 Tax=Desulfobacula phenolica TaxID=90732 RepID=A0A1H2IBT7_9BACT|nr:DEAD/DEAH box helicase [Desulfobacula phenolica]SDU41455.1 Superfamily II DNA or RNA helicase, SNF2 family [Desulfobacula phenolica]
MIVENKSANNELVMAYRLLSPVLKTMVRILAVQVFEFRQKDMIYCLNTMEFTDEYSKPFVQKTIQPLVKELESQGLIIKKPKGLTCSEPVWSQALQDVVMAGQFKEIAFAVLDAIPFKRTHAGFVFRNIHEAYRAILIAVYGGEDCLDIDKVYASIRYYLPIEFWEHVPFLTLFNRPFTPWMLDVLAPAMRMAVLEYLLKEAEPILEPVEVALDYYVELLSKSSGLEENYNAMVWLLLSGKIKAHQQIVSKFKNSSSRSAHLGCALMLCNKNDEALIQFKDALVFLKKKTRKRKIFLPGYEGLFFLFALLKSEKSEDHEAALTYIDMASGDTTLCLPVTEAMRSLFQERLGLVSVLQNSLESSVAVEHLVVSFLSILVMSWIDKKKAESYIFQLENIQKKTMAAGLLWMEAEVCALLASLGHDAKHNIERSKKNHKLCGTHTLATLVKPIPKWEKTLKSLIHIGQASGPKPEPGTDKRNQRLIWILGCSETYNTCYITPRLQKLSKNGTWTKGRAVALKNLYNNYHTMEGLTDQDRRVCSTIIEEFYRTGYGYYHQVEYGFDEEKALPLLVGHPLLFLGDSLESPVELVMGDPEVRFRIDKGKINIAIHPMPDSNDSTALVVRETPSRFKLVRFSSEQLQIADLLGENGLKLPEKAQDMASQVIGSLSSLVTVNSDLAGAGSEHVREIKADPIPHVHVMPWQDGIKIELLVRPFIDTGSYFKPGRGGINVFAEIKGEKLQAVRDLSREKQLSQAVIEQCSTLEHLEEVGGQWLVADPEEALELLLDLKNCDDNIVMEWPQGEKMQVRSQVSFNDFKLNIKKDREWFKATGTLKIDENLSLDLVKLMSLLDKPSGRFVAMDDGTFLSLTHSLKERLEELKAYSTPHGKGLRFAPLAVHAIEEFTDQAGSLKSDKAWKIHCEKLKEIVTPDVPGTLQARLRDYQVTGFNWLAQLAHWNVGACLADDMGLGKTVQALAAILLYAGDGPGLVVAPLSVMANWQEECRNFAPTLNPLVFGPGDRQNFLDGLGPFDLVISSYGLLQVEAEKLAGVDWQSIVLDEAQAIKNMKTKRSKAAMALNSRFKMITTGTPVENHLDELWTLFNFLNPGLLGTFNRFKNSFAVPIERDQDKDASRRLKKLIRPFILRRLKTDVLKELPEKTEITLQVEMSQEEAVLYEAQRIKAIANIENADDKPGQKHLRILAELMKLRQICCNPALVLPDAGIDSSKLRVFGDIVAELLENNHKALVFSQFVGHLTILRKFLDAKNITYQYLDGSTAVKTRQERIKAFQNGSGDLFLISLKAGGFGLNLTAADYVIHMDPWWNPAVEDQASDRAHRIGQVRPVTVYRLVVKDSIEERIISLHQEKRDLAESLLAGSDMAGKISAADLLSLLKG